MKNLIKLVLVFALAAGFAACSKNVKEKPAGDKYAAGGHMTEISAEEVAILQDDDGVYGVGFLSGSSVHLTPVYFELDKYVLTRDTMAVLDANVAALKAKGAPAVTVEGHCDARGTVAYNIALGDKRAKEIKDYYVKRGIAAKNIKTVSYGKEKPVCFDSTETCWSQNRRGDTIIM